MEFEGPQDRFIEGAAEHLVKWDKFYHSADHPMVIRGLKSMSGLKYCETNNIDYYYIDTGYFGNGKHKVYHRVTKNNLQYLGPIVDRPKLRFEHMGVRPVEITNGSEILLVPPSNKVMRYYGHDLTEWIDNTIIKLREHTDRKINIRIKPPRRERVSTNSLEAALQKDIYCVVTFNSIAAVESLIYGKPAITLGPNAAQELCSTKIEDIESIKKPSLDEVYRLLRHLAYHQFKVIEMSAGIAWKLLHDL